MKFSDRAIQEVGWAFRKAHGHESITATMFYVLREMKACKDGGWNFVDLGHLHTTTVKTLEERGWIFASKGIDGVKHSITRRGELAVRIYSTPRKSRRSDGICPRCNERKRRVRSSGVLAPYCSRCEGALNKRLRELGLIYKRPGICPMCKTRNKHVPPSGIARPYCKVCASKRRKEEKRRINERNLDRMEQGEILYCYDCKKEPREIVNGWVRDQCGECRRKYQRAYRIKRRNRK